MHLDQGLGQLQVLMLSELSALSVDILQIVSIEESVDFLPTVSIKDLVSFEH